MQAMSGQSLAQRTLIECRVYDQLGGSPRGAVVLERVAFGAGATNWFVCTTMRQLDAVAAELLPGSCVSFYFDDRIKRRGYTADVHTDMVAIIHQTGDVVVGTTPVGDIHLEVDFIAGPEELGEFTKTLGSASVLYYGPFPARDNDGVSAITVIVPDADGVIRPHPY